MTRHLAFYDNVGLSYDIDKWYDALFLDKIPFVVAPTQQMACDWIEKKHHYIIDVHLDVESEEASSLVWSVYECINVEGREPYARLYFEDDEPYEIDNQEFAYNDALKYVLTNLI